MDLTDELIAKGVLKTPRIIEAFRAVDRRDFVPKELHDTAYRDEPLPLGYGQTISQPYTVACMLELLQPHGGDRVLDVGFGSGWQTTLLAHIVGKRGKVVAYERIGRLYEFGKTNIKKYAALTDGVVETHLGDATRVADEVFERIISAAAAKNFPNTWQKALATGGSMVGPLGNSLWAWRKREGGNFEKEERPGFVFVPLVESGKVSLRVLLIIFFMGILAFGFFVGLIAPPRPTTPSPLTIPRGATANDIAALLKERNIIRSRILFIWFTYLGGIHERIAAGRYSFSEPLSLFQVFGKLAVQQEERTVVIPEGIRVREIDSILKDNGMLAASSLSALGPAHFSKYEFLRTVPADSLEGFLFPDTYRFFAYATPEEVASVMLANFEKKMVPLAAEITASGKNLYDIIVMASLLEKEVITKEDKEIVSGILWKRLNEGRLLQVDATLFYENGKASHELSRDDLENPTPYNTYVHKGLPPGPISNPGLESIEAALRPKESPYYFYLTGADGATHYASMFEEHVANKARYLR